MREKLQPYGRQSLDDHDVQAVVDALKSDWLTTRQKIAEFEEVIRRLGGRPLCRQLQFRTAAVHGAAFAADCASVMKRLRPLLRVGDVVHAIYKVLTHYTAKGGQAWSRLSRHPE